MRERERARTLACGLEECLRTELLASGEEGDFRSVHECLEVLYSRLLAAVEDSFVRVEEVAKERFFYVPEAQLADL